jgi:hypothetical protein
MNAQQSSSNRIYHQAAGIYRSVCLLTMQLLGTMITLKMTLKRSSAHTLRSFRAMATKATFSEVQMGLTDPIQILKRDYDLDTTPSKVDLGAGVLRDERGRTYEFPVIQKVRLDLHVLIDAS